MPRYSKIILSVFRFLGWIIGVIGAYYSIAGYYKWNEAPPVASGGPPMMNYWPHALLVIGIVLVVSTWIIGYFAFTAGRPKFILTMLGGNVFTPTLKPSLTGIVLDIRIRNASQFESIATDWKLVVIIPGQQTQPAQLTRPPHELTLAGPNPLVLKDSDFSFEETAASRPLKINDPPLEGKILFYVDLPQAKVLDENTILQLTVDDSAGRTFSAVQAMGHWMRA